ncbi:MAG: carboxylating nicotinate-nucleotide diphosphorylase [Chlamydiia bacterium]|nr:carboxylating nicotinate-nucleotide diphosphorylase [Chlamydiia bacterium]
MEPLDEAIERLIDTALAEDLGAGDITSEACIPADVTIGGKFVLKQAATVAGLIFLEPVFKRVDPSIEVKLLVKEGSHHNAGATLALVSGPARSILSGERVALNLIQHTCGVATVTSAYVRRISGFGVEILDTRKTLPGLRAVEKYSVRMGGGTNHRRGLDDRFIIKNNHLRFISRKTPDYVVEAIERALAYRPDVIIEVEVENMDQLEAALSTDVSVIMLDNMTPQEAAKAVKRVRQSGKKIYVESSGGITLDTIRSYAETGVDGISVGALTHSVPAVDISLRLSN